MSDVRLYMLERKDQEKAVQVLFRSFQKDPFFKYLLGASSEDALVAAPFQEFIVNLGMKYGEVYAPSNRLEGVAVWLPPRAAHVTNWKCLRCGVRRIQRTLPSRLREPVWQRLLAFSGYSEGLYKKYLKRPHWYLLAIGVADAYRGKGYASKLVRPMLARCDEQALPCYLETHDDHNVPLYEHFGFSVIENSCIPGSSQRQWSMLRQPVMRSE